MRISHPGYEPADCLVVLDVATLQPGADPRLAVRCPMVALPALGALDGSVRSLGGNPLPGVTIRLTGPRNAEFTSDASGRFNATELPPGAYELEASAAGQMPQKRTLLVPGGQTLFPELVLQPALPPPGESSVRVTKRALVIKRQVHFRKKSAELEPDGLTLLDEVAATLAQNPALKRVEIQGHTDNRGMPALNRQLSQARAESVREYLLRAGVAADRLSARGYGDTRPLVPNLTDENRARNRRVEFIILERGAQ
jgi:outer membrane protein OmpA-like peptidoglycan-associated protein